MELTQICDLAVIGGGPAGMAAALEAYQSGVEKIVIIERDKELGGILNQCIHNGFGLHYFKEELTGPEYAQRFSDQIPGTTIQAMTDTMVLDISPDKTIHLVNTKNGYQQLKAKAIVLAMGCRERTRGAIGIPGERPSGVFTAGAAQRYLNMEGYLVGKRAVILGSGDIGLIMARRLSLEGAKVLACVELMPYSNGLNRNVVQCLNDFEIPLYLSHTITRITGTPRVESVTISKVDEKRNPIPGTEITFQCDTVLLSVGLIPENELSKTAGIALDPRTRGPVVFENMETSVEGIFACGNTVHVHDLVDFVTAESQRAGRCAAAYIKGQSPSPNAFLPVTAGSMVNYTVPQKIHLPASAPVEIFFRVAMPMKDKKIVVTASGTGEKLMEFKRLHLTPGEMEHITIPTSALEKAPDGIEIAIV